MSVVKYSLIAILISLIYTQTQVIGQIGNGYPFVGGSIQTGSTHQIIEIKTSKIITLSLTTGVSNTILLAPALLNQNNIPSPLTGFTYSYNVNNLPVWASFQTINSTLKINPPLTYRGGAQIEIIYSDSRNIKEILKANLGLKNGVVQYDFSAIQQQYRFQNTFTLAFPIFQKNNGNSVIIPGKYYIIDSGIYPWSASVSLSQVISGGVMSNYGIGHTIGQSNSPVVTQTVNTIGNYPVIFPTTTQINSQLGHYVNYQSQQMNEKTNSNFQANPISNTQTIVQTNSQLNNKLNSQNNSSSSNKVQKVNVVNISTNNNIKDAKAELSTTKNISNQNVIVNVKTNQVVPQSYQSSQSSQSKIIVTPNIIQSQNPNSFVGKVLTSYSSPQSKLQISQAKGTVLPIVFQHPITNSNKGFTFNGSNQASSSQTLSTSSINQNRNVVPSFTNGGVNQMKLQVQQQQSEVIAHPPIINSQQNQIFTTSSSTSSSLNSAPPLINGHGIVVINEKLPVQVISQQSGNSVPSHYLNNKTTTTTTTIHNTGNINSNINNNTNLGTYVNNNVNTNMNNNIVVTNFPTVNNSSISTNTMNVPNYNSQTQTTTTTTTTNHNYSPSSASIVVTPVLPPQLSNLQLNSQSISQLIPIQQTYMVGELPLIPIDQIPTNVIRTVNTTYIQQQPIVVTNFSTINTNNQPLIKPQLQQNSNLISNINSNSQSNLINGQIISFENPNTKNIQGGFQQSYNNQVINNTIQQTPQVINTQTFQSSPSTITINRTYVTTSPMSTQGNTTQIINNSSYINNDLTSLLNQLNLTIPKDLLDSSKYQTHTITTTTSNGSSSLSQPATENNIIGSSNIVSNGITTTQPSTSTYTITKTSSHSPIVVTSPVIANLTNSINSIGSNLSALGITIPSK